MAVGSNRKVELMAPAGDFASLTAALRSGADSVYLGVGGFHMRAGATERFSVDDLPKVARLCHAANVRAYLTLNIVSFDSELRDIEQLIVNAKGAGFDAVIASDPAVIAIANRLGIPVHLSVQTNVANMESVRFWAPHCDVIVLARELFISQIKTIAQAIDAEGIRGASGQPLRIEAFAHGALCVAFSGRCNMSLGLHGTNASANRGRCVQPCRRRYRVTDVETGDALEVDGGLVMSPRDLCTVQRLDELLGAGVSVLKLEGRGRSADYVATVTSVYREAIDAWTAGHFAEVRDTSDWMTRLEQVFNRGFWEGGYYLGNENAVWTTAHGSSATEQKTHIGKVTAYYAKIGVGECLLQAGELSVGDEVWVIGKTTGAQRFRIDKLHVGDEGQETQVACQGEVVAFPVPCKIRIGDILYRIDQRRLK